MVSLARDPLGRGSPGRRAFHIPQTHDILALVAITGQGHIGIPERAEHGACVFRLRLLETGRGRIDTRLRATEVERRICSSSSADLRASAMRCC
jgi:hypothetical protein